MKVEAAVVDHPKTYSLARIWGCHVYTVAGFLIKLWGYCLEFQDDGDLNEIGDEVLERLAAPCVATAIGTLPPPREALQRVGFVDADGSLHDWEDYAGAMLERRIRDRRRKADRREIEAAGSFRQEDWVELVGLCGHRCAYCGRVRTRLGQDHVVPLSRDGEHKVGNIVPCCKRCNTKKGTRTPEQAGMPVQPEVLAAVAGTRFALSYRVPSASNPSPISSSIRVEKSRVEKSRKQQQQQPLPVTPVKSLDYPTRCCVAVNRVLEQQLAGAFIPLVPNVERQTSLAWEAAGIPIELVEEVLADLTGRFPNGRSRQPQSLGYFTAALHEAHAKRQASGGPGLLTDADRMRAAAAAEREREQGATR